MFSQIHFIIAAYNKKIKNSANAEHKNNLSLRNRTVKKRLIIHIKKNKNAAIKAAKVIKRLIIATSAFKKRNIVRIKKTI